MAKKLKKNREGAKYRRKLCHIYIFGTNINT
jgi:hypothetical protein